MNHKPISQTVTMAQNTAKFMALIIGLIMAFSLTVSVSGAHAESGSEQGLSPELEKRAQYLEHDLRCVTCAGQSLADSSAPMAVDLKAFVRRELVKGRSEEAIKADLVQKYGPTILARPPLSGVNWLLWLAPGILLIAAALFVVIWLHRGRSQADGITESALNEDEKHKFDQIRQQNRDQNTASKP